MLFVHKRLSSCAETAQLKVHELPLIFMNLTVSNLNPCDFATSGHTCDVSIHEQHSQNVLESENFKIILVTGDGDGDSLFYAVAFNLLQLLQTGPLPPHIVQILDIGQDLTITELVKQL